MYPFTNLVPHEFGVVFIGFAGQHDVVEIGQPFLETALGPKLLIFGQPLFRLDFHGGAGVELVHERARRFQTLLKDLRIVGLDLALGLVVDWAVSQRSAEISGPLIIYTYFVECELVLSHFPYRRLSRSIAN